eukprot:3574771-Rhodomonas_salina.1
MTSVGDRARTDIAYVVSRRQGNSRMTWEIDVEPEDDWAQRGGARAQNGGRVGEEKDWRNGR